MGKCMFIAQNQDAHQPPTSHQKEKCLRLVYHLITPQIVGAVVRHHRNRRHPWLTSLSNLDCALRTLRKLKKRGYADITLEACKWLNIPTKEGSLWTIMKKSWGVLTSFLVQILTEADASHCGIQPGQGKTNSDTVPDIFQHFSTLLRKTCDQYFKCLDLAAKHTFSHSWRHLANSSSRHVWFYHNVMSFIQWNQRHHSKPSLAWIALRRFSSQSRQQSDSTVASQTKAR